MKKSLIILLVVGVGIAAFVLSRTGDSSNTGTTTADNSMTKGKEDGDDSSKAINRKEFLGKGDLDENSDLTDEGVEEEEARPAYEVYKTADEALDALKKGAQDYDDLILEQFTDLGPDCQWCDAFYNSVRDVMSAADTSAEQRSYFAEVLAISGRIENIQSLVEQIKNAKNSDESDVYAEALELTVGKDDVVKYLSTQLDSDNQPLKDASVAAITNQGSKLAVEALFKHVVERGDPDGYYSQGIGPGEMIPDEEALPALQDYITRRDGYSHLAAKAMLNNGVDGLKRFLDILENSNDAGFDTKLVNGLEDHVPYEEAAEAILKDKIANAKNEVTKKFAEKALADFNMEEQGPDDEAE